MKTWIKFSRSETSGRALENIDEIKITTADEPIIIKNLDNGEIVVLYDGECFLSIQS